MADKITYYASIGGDRAVSNPYGLLRRTEHDDGADDEALEADLVWRPTSLITEWEAGEGVYELVEVGASQAEEIISTFRQRWDQNSKSLWNACLLIV
jgi:hypothetical protein